MPAATELLKPPYLLYTQLSDANAELNKYKWICKRYEI